MAVGLALVATGVAAQDPIPEDTIPPAGAEDPVDEPAPIPPAILPAIHPVGPSGWAAGVWEWDRRRLLLMPDLSVLHLLQRIPGMVPVRTPPVAQAEGVAVLGATTRGVRYIVDGFELDPLTTPTFDPSRLALVALERVRVERRVTGAVVHIETLSATDARPQSMVEAGTGDLGINLFRGTFLAPRVLGGPVAAGFERLASEGAPGARANNTVTWVKWGWLGDEGGIQLEYRSSEVDRSGFDGGLTGSRTDWVARARRELGPVTGELYLGASSVEDAVGESVRREGGTQGGLRLRSVLPAPFPVEASAGLRLRGHPRAPARQLEVEAHAAPVPWLGLGVDARQDWWRDDEATGRWSARARAGPFGGVTVFGDRFGGSPPLGRGDVELRVPRMAAPPLELSRTGARAGIELARWGLVIGAAAVRTEADSVPGFGLAFDPTAPAFIGGEASGFEAHASIPTGWDPLRVEGWYVSMTRPPGWLYLPAEQWRAGLTYYHLPLPSGNLEILARAEQTFRGRMSVPAEAGPVPVGAARAINLELTIRVLDVHAFLRWENIFHRQLQEDLPGRLLPGQTAVYGVRWNFWN